MAVVICNGHYSTDKIFRSGVTCSGYVLCVMCYVLCNGHGRWSKGNGFFLKGVILIINGTKLYSGVRMFTGNYLSSTPRALRIYIIRRAELEWRPLVLLYIIQLYLRVLYYIIRYHIELVYSLQGSAVLLRVLYDILICNTLL
jgi:hypothetical protein